MHDIQQELRVLLCTRHVHAHGAPLGTGYLSREHGRLSENSDATIAMFENGTLEESVARNTGRLHAEFPRQRGQQ